MTIPQLPKHGHGDGYIGKSGKGFPDGSGDETEVGADRSYPKITQKLADAGGGETHENRPPYYVMAYILRLG